MISVTVEQHQLVAILGQIEALAEVGESELSRVIKHLGVVQVALQ